MRKEFIFIPKEETATEYLTRMSAILGALRKDGVSTVDPRIIASIDAEEKGEIKNEVATVLKKPVSSAARYYIKKFSGTLSGYEEDFKQELWFEVFNNIHKFNNPAYLQGEQKYSIDTFVGLYARNVNRKILGEKRERKEHEMNRENHVKKILEALCLKKGITEPSVEEIYKNQELANDSMFLTLLQIQDVLMSMDGISYLEDIPAYEAESEESYFDYVEQEDIIKDFVKDMSVYPKYEMYIYLQSLRLRSNEITNKEIACDRELVKLCKDIPALREKVIHEKIIIGKPKSGIEPYLEFNEYVSLTYIESTYRKYDRIIRKKFEKKNLDRSEMLAIIKYLMNL